MFLLPCTADWLINVLLHYITLGVCTLYKYSFSSHKVRCMCFINILLYYVKTHCIMIRLRTTALCRCFLPFPADRPGVHLLRGLPFLQVPEEAGQPTAEPVHARPPYAQHVPTQPRPQPLPRSGFQGFQGLPETAETVQWQPSLLSPRPRRSGDGRKDDDDFCSVAVQ